MSSRVAGILVGLLAVAVLAGTVAMWVDFQDRVDEVTSGTETSAPTPRPSPTPSPSRSPGSSPRPAEEVSSLWIGDGYTAEACFVAGRLDWTCTVDAQQGTGFLSDGSSFDPDFGTVGDRLDGLPRADPDVVVVDAGRNDLGVYTTAALLAEMDDYLSRLRARYPEADLVQIVPWTAEDPTSDPALTAEVQDLMATYDGHALAADGAPLEGAVLAARLRDLHLG